MRIVIEGLQPYSPDIPLLKSSYASIAPLPNASISSKSSQGVDYLGLIRILGGSDVSFPRYKVEDLIQDPTLANNHNAVKDGLASWMRRRRLELSNLTIITEKSLGMMSSGHSELWVNCRKIVDLVITDGDLRIVQLEVESSEDRMATIQKLAYGLADQLRYLNNHRDSTVSSISGFYVPGMSRG